MRANPTFILAVFAPWITISAASSAEHKPAGAAPPLALAPFTAALARTHQDAWAKHLGQPREVTNSIGMRLTLIPPGEFLMGNGESAEETHRFFNRTYGTDSPKADRYQNEYPRHRVRITQPFYLGTCHVTRGQFRRFVDDTGYKTDAEKGDNPGLFGWKGAWGYDERRSLLTWRDNGSWHDVGFAQDDDHPVVAVSWNDAVAFCQWLSRKEHKTYRLPTEAEWEFSCRAGTSSRYYFGDAPEELARCANVLDSAGTGKLPNWDRPIAASDGYAFTSPIGRFQPNAFGLFDMHGNVWQWCADWYDEKYYATSLVDDPRGPRTGENRVLRGGSFCLGPHYCRSALRSWYQPWNRASGDGFRIARSD